MAEHVVELPNGDTVITFDNRRSLQFSLKDIYRYRLVDESEEVIYGGGQYVPLVGDVGYDRELGWFWVTFSDPTTYTVNLSKWNAGNGNDGNTQDDAYLNTASGESWRVYIDERELPYRLTIDAGFRSYLSDMAYFVVYRGINITDTGEIISLTLDQNGDVSGYKIPAQLAATITDSTFSPEAEINNLAIKTPTPAYTTKDLRQGELVTVVGYSQDGILLRKWSFLIQKATDYRLLNSAMKRVNNIQLLSQYLSSDQPNTLLVPLGTNVDSLAVRARVSYTDGSSRIMDVGLEGSGSKFMLYGLKYWSPSVPGAATKLNLMYRLSVTEEYAGLEGVSVNGYIKEPYQIVATEINPATSLKLFGFPTWIAANNAYTMEYWLYDLLRQRALRVPANAIQYVEGSGVFDGMDYLSVQTLTLSVMMNVLDPIWGSYRHAQRMRVALLREGTNPSTNWRVKSSSNQLEWYGDDKRAWLSVVGGSVTLDVSCGYSTQAEWVDNIYYAQEPIYNPMAEAKAPEPTHFIIVGRQSALTFPIAQWGAPLGVPNEFIDGQTVYIQFIARRSGGDLQLGVAGMPVHRR